VDAVTSLICASTLSLRSPPLAHITRSGPLLRLAIRPGGAARARRPSQTDRFLCQCPTTTLRSQAQAAAMKPNSRRRGPLVEVHEVRSIWTRGLSAVVAGYAGWQWLFEQLIRQNPHLGGARGVQSSDHPDAAGARIGFLAQRADGFRCRQHRLKDYFHRYLLRRAQRGCNFARVVGYFCQRLGAIQSWLPLQTILRIVLSQSSFSPRFLSCRTHYTPSFLEYASSYHRDKLPHFWKPIARPKSFPLTNALYQSSSKYDIKRIRFSQS